MRVVLGTKTSNQRWLPLELSAAESQIVREALRRKLVLSTDELHYRQFMSEIREIQAPPQERTRLGDLLRRVPFVPRETKPPVDLYAEDFASRADSKLLSVLTSPDFTRLVDQRAGSVLRGEQREDVFQRFFLPYAAAASGLCGLDKFLFTNLDSGRAEGLTWLLQNCIDNGAGYFVLFSALPPSQDLSRCKQVLLSRLKRPIWMRQKNIAVSVTLIAAHHKLGSKKDGGDGAWVHDRHVRFRIGTDAQRLTPTFDIGPGFGVFDHDEVRENFNLIEATDRRAARAREDEVSRLADRPFETVTLV